MDDLRCKDTEKRDIPVLGDIIDKAFNRRGMTGTGASLASSIGNLSNIRLIYWQHDGTQHVLGACPIREYPCHFGPAKLVSGALSLLAIDPAFQRRGIGQKMLRCAQEYMLGQGFDTCLLFTGSPSFYQHTGWAQAINEFYCEIPARAIHAKPSLSTAVLQARDIPGIARAYETFNTNRALTKARDEAWWRKALNVNGLAPRFTCVADGGHLLGYGCIELVVPAGWKPPGNASENAVPVRGNRLVREPRVEVSEYAITSSAPADVQGRVLDAILSRARDVAIESGCGTVGTPLPGSFPLSRRLRDAGATVKDSWWSSMMVLVVNLPAFLEKLKRYQEEVIIPRVPKETTDAIADFDIWLSIGHEHEQDTVFVQYTKENGTLAVNISREHGPRTAIPASTRQLAQMALGNYTPANLVDCECWTCPRDALDPLGLFFNTTDNLVYQNDHF